MTSKMKRMTCRALVVSLLALSFQTANAGMIGADQASAPTQSQTSTQRGMVLSVLDRAETAAQLQAQGIDPAEARARVATMTDQEVQQLTQDMHTAPAGALSNGGWLAVIIIAGLVWYFAFRK
ncbi:MAG: PA2779 family protein [Stagnimonas sp.]|nr:PA2779 family protein [Stagnimonas sp.]